MEIVLFAFTVLSTIVAVVMSVVAWRLSREERARASARVAALAAAAAEPYEGSVTVVEPVPLRAPAAVPALAAESVAMFERELPLRAVATASSTLRGQGETASSSPRRSYADASPASPLRTHVETSPSPLRGFGETDYASDLRGFGDADPAIGDTFLGTAESRTASNGRQRVLVFAAAVLLVVLGGGAYVTLSNNDSGTSHTAAAPAATNAPLELISLRQERKGARLTLSGLVRNPAAGVPIDDLAAVVFLFDGQGGFISSARVGVDFRRLGPGDESPFVITVDAPPTVARYRVSFRTDAGIVAHSDRRNDQPIAAATVGRE
jgi:hypothetical protein